MHAALPPPAPNPGVPNPEHPSPGRSILRRTLGFCAYGAAFTLLHGLAALWGASSSFSLWFPAAGLRFAVMWRLPPRLLPLCVLAEFLARAFSSDLLLQPRWLEMFGTLNAPICYALAILLVKRLASGRRSSLSTPPMPMGLAMILCPVVAVSGSLPWAMLAGPHGALTPDLRQLLGEAGIYWIGDLLGIWMIAPPLLWLSSQSLPPFFARPGWTMTPRLWEALCVVAAGCALSGLLGAYSGDVHVEPLLMSAIWLALRVGRMGAWIVSALATLIILIAAGPDMALADRANLHLLVATFAIAAYLVGSYAEAQQVHQRDLARAERLLLRADRLKTLRAMSLAAIHDISQPLSTLSLEARYVRELAAQPAFDRDEMIATSALIERKTHHLTELVRRMRAFGSNSDQRVESPVPIAKLLGDVIALTRTEAERAGATLDLIVPDESLRIVGQEIELQQALVNLVRNAIAAAQGGQIVLRGLVAAGQVRLEVIDTWSGRLMPDPAGAGTGMGQGMGQGMGLGLIIARTVAEAHGGSLAAERIAPHGSCYALCLPLPSPGERTE